jgi:uncharacterized protein YbjT (DUF2867 family)
MKILLTGANGYIGSHLFPLLCEAGHHIVAFSRDPQQLRICPHLKDQVEVIEGNLQNPETIKKIPKDVEAAYFLIHSISHYGTDFAKLDATSAHNFVNYLKDSSVQQVIYLGGIANKEADSADIRSRFSVANILREGRAPVTVLRTGLVIGPGSSLLEIVRGVVEKNPIIILPKWANSLCQPIATYDLMHYLLDVVGNEKCVNKTFDVGGPEVLSFKEVIIQFAKFRGLKRIILPVPLMLSKVSSYFMQWMSPISLPVTSVVVNNLKHDFICSDNEITEILPKRLLNYEEALQRSFKEFEDVALVESWESFFSKTVLERPELQEYIVVPSYGCLHEVNKVDFTENPEHVLDRIWNLGGSTGWYYMDWVWKFRGALDKLFGGDGFRKVRPTDRPLGSGDYLDFWRVILADKAAMRLILFAEIKLPGEAWLEFKIDRYKDRWMLVQTMTFRPKGLFGRLYWYLFFPIHRLILREMSRRIVNLK